MSYVGQISTQIFTLSGSILDATQQSDGKRRVIELDYGMKNGESELQCRQALLFYTLRQLGLTQEAKQAPEAQQIILKNRAELESYLSSLQSSS